MNRPPGEYRLSVQTPPSMTSPEPRRTPPDGALNTRIAPSVNCVRAVADPMPGPATLHRNGLQHVSTAVEHGNPAQQAVGSPNGVASRPRVVQDLELAGTLAPASEIADEDAGRVEKADLAGETVDDDDRPVVQAKRLRDAFEHVVEVARFIANGEGGVGGESPAGAGGPGGAGGVDDQDAGAVGDGGGLLGGEGEVGGGGQREDCGETACEDWAGHVSPLAGDVVLLVQFVP